MDNLIHLVKQVMELSDYTEVDKCLQSGWILLNAYTSNTYVGDKIYSQTIFILGEIR